MYFSQDFSCAAMKKDTQKLKKTKFRRYFRLGIVLVLLLLALALALMAYKPGRYAPVRVADQNQISPYLTHHLLPTLYNNSQRGQPFEVVITQEGLNDIIARSPQPIKLHNITLTDLQVVLKPQQITLMATAKARPVDLVLTIELNPTINQQGLLNLHINSVALGAVSFTSVARLMGERAYSDWMSSTGMEPNNIAAQVCRSLLNNEPFEPVFEFGRKRLRVSRIDVSVEKITTLLTPAPD
jgi:uncharacterized protein YpmS